VRYPRQCAAVIAGGRAHQSSRGGFVTKAMDRITDADDLERIQAKPMRFVLRVDALEGERSREALE